MQKISATRQTRNEASHPYLDDLLLAKDIIVNITERIEPIKQKKPRTKTEKPDKAIVKRVEG